MSKRLRASALAVAMQHNHEAFMAKVATRPDYERREEPEEASMASVATSLDLIAESLEDFQRRMNSRIDGIERRMQRPGAGATDPSESAEQRSDFRMPEGTEDIRVLRSTDDFERHYSLRMEKRGKSPNSSRMTLGDFMRGVARMQTSDEVRASLQVGTDASGGYAVPDVLLPGILQAMVPGSALMQAGAGILDLSDALQGGKTFTSAAIETLPTPGWRQELGAVAESEPTFRAIVAQPRSLALVVRASRELMADAANMTTALNVAIGQAMALEMDRVGLRGTGTAPQPRGILNTTDVNAVNQGTNGATIANYDPILSGMLSIRKANCRTPTAAITSPDALFKYAGLKDTTNQPLQMPELVRRLNWFDTTQVPVNLTVGTSTDCTEIYLGDFSAFYYILREAMSIRLLDQAFYSTGEIGFLVHLRMDVMIPYPKAFTVVKGSRVG